MKRGAPPLGCRTLLSARPEYCPLASTGAFRVAVGAVLFCEVARFVTGGWVSSHFLAPRLLFTYHGLEWLAPLPAVGMYLLFLALGILSAMILLGYKYRLAMALLWIGFTYVALLDKAQYLNHFYFVSLLCFLMIFVPAGGMWSLDAWLDPALRQETMPAWKLWLLRFQIGIPYFYGGLAKLNGDWLHGQPMQTWMWFMTDLRQRFPAFGEHWLALLFSYGGLAFDLSVVPLLLWRRTRPYAFAAAVAFHVMNHFMFHIGIFPWLMIAATTLFFEPDWPRRVLKRLRLGAGKGLGLGARGRKDRGQESGDRSQRGIAPKLQRQGKAERRKGDKHERQDTPQRAERHGRRSLQSESVSSPQPPASSHQPPASSPQPPISRATMVLVALYVLIQLLVPFRHYLYPGNVDWTDEGYHFSWRMMLNEKPAVVQFLAEEPTGQKFAVDPRAYLSPHQIGRMARDPEMLREFAAFLKRDLAAQGHPDVKIRVIALVSLNGRKPQLLVDPTIDLGSEPRRWGPQPWIVPLTEPLRLPPWNVPPKDWAKYVEVPGQ